MVVVCQVPVTCRIELQNVPVSDTTGADEKFKSW
jgi:hypothetical protein